MSTPNIKHFVDEHGNFIYRAEIEGSFLSKEEVKALAKYVSVILAENAKLRELVRDMWKMQDALPYGAHIEIHNRMRELGVDA